MISAPNTKDELQRLKALFDYNVLDTDPEQTFDSLTQLASEICNTPIALVSLIDESRQWFKSHHGLDATETPREMAFCAHAIHGDDIFEIKDSRKDERFHDNPLVTGDPRVIFYAGSPLLSPDGHNLGTLCVIGHEPKELSDAQRKQLNILSAQVIQLLELRKANIKKEEAFDSLLNLSENIEEHNNELKEFSTRMAHDMKGPVRQIQSLARFCIEDIQNDQTSEVTKHLNMITSRCDTLQEFIQNVYELSCANLGSCAVNEIDFDKIIHLAWQNCEDIAEKKNVTLHSDISVRHPWQLEEIRIQQILNNLISNAVKYSDSSKASRFVRVSVIESDDHNTLTLIIEDNGLGVPEECQPHLFDKFERFHPDCSDGTGLGMSIIQKHVNALAGQLEFESGEQGSKFSISLKR